MARSCGAGSMKSLMVTKAGESDSFPSLCYYIWLKRKVDNRLTWTSEVNLKNMLLYTEDRVVKIQIYDEVKRRTLRRFNRDNLPIIVSEIIAFANMFYNIIMIFGKVLVIEIKKRLL